MSRPWRLLIDEPLDGALNMALDRAALTAHEQGLAPATLRLYRWTRPTVTLGRFQDASEIDFDECRRAGVDVARRATGGRGVLHDDELTYSLVAGIEDGVPRGVTDSYRLLSTALAAAYGRMGVEARLVSRDAPGPGSGACYLSATRADLVHAGRKLSGSAQVWSGSSLLQHGSFTRTRNIELESRVFRLDATQRERLMTTTATLADALTEPPLIDDMVGAVREAFEDVLGVELVPGCRSAFEAAAAGDMIRACRVSGSE